jgi:uncharacterized membrane protein YgdD (TMEM256/DUF423 family)
MNRKFLHMAAIMGGLAVILGAFGSHLLKRLLDAETLAAFQTGVTYQFYHAFALLAVGILYRRYMNNWLTLAGMFFVLGTILFSGSLYLMAAVSILKKSSLGVFGFITPLGGLLFVAGWFCFFLGVPSSRKVQDSEGGGHSGS